MSADSPNPRELFLAAIQLPPEQWESYVHRSCAGNATLKQRLLELLAAHRDAGSILTPDVAAQSPTVLQEAPWEGPGQQIGPYKLLEPIGEGGFGIVYLAEQTAPVRRRVALKVLKPGMDTRQVVARFEAERQALALMDHPNIATVFDGGTTPGGRPYFVMELVKGSPITEFCDTNRFTPRERLELFVTVCQAVQHAHQKGIIHRDLKPSNVLVTVHDTVPVVKVIDFGVAKALGQELTEKTLFTGFTHMIGTPLYMSPEQAGQSGLDVDTRSDVYSLGVLLYELLTGTTPFSRDRLRQAAYDEIRRIIQEEEPPRPSARLSELSQIDPKRGATGTRPASARDDRVTSLASVSAVRKTDPHRLSRLVRGELDWIVMKALEKDRTRRYATAQGFAGDVQRYLDDEPVLACPPSAAYRLTKLMRRHKAALATLAALVLLLITATVGAVLAAVQSDEIAQQAQQLAAAAEERADIETRARTQLDRRLYANRIALAQQELYAQNSGRAQELLDECPRALRGWEWNFLKRFRPGNPVTVTRNTRGATFTPDGRFLGLCDPSRPILVDPETGTIVRTFPQLTTAADYYGLAFCVAGEKTVLAVGDSGGMLVKLWDVATGEELGTLEGMGQRLRTVVFSPDGRQLAAGCINGGAKIWDWSQGRVLFEFPDWSISRLVYSPNGAHLACSVFGQDQDVRICDASTGALLSAFSAQHENGIEALDYSPDSLRIATSGNDGTLKVWEAATGRLLLILRGHFGPVRDVAYSPDGRRLASAGWDKTVKIWDAENGHELLTLRGHSEMVMKVTFDSAGHRLASTGADQLVIWNALPGDEQVGEVPLRLPGHTGAVRQVEYSRDGRYLVTAGTDRRIQLWDAADLRRGVTAPFETRFDDSTTDLTVTFHPDSRRLVSAGTKGWLRMWDLSERLPGWSLRLMDQPTGRTVRDLEFSPDGKRLETIGPGGVTIRDGANGERLNSLQIPSGNLFALAHHPDGRQVAACHHFSVMVIDVDTLTTVRSLSHPSLVSSVAYTTDGRRLAAACFDHCVYLWDSQTGKMLRRLTGHSDRVMTVAFSPNAELLASGSGDGTVKIWNAATGEELVTLRGHSGYVSSLAFNPNGQQLTSTGGHDGKGEVSVWDLVKRLPSAADTAAFVQTRMNEAGFHRLASIAQPKIWQHHQRLARACADLNQWDRAIDAYTAAVALNPSFLAELAESLWERQRVDEADRLIDQLLVVSQQPQPNSPREAKLQETLARHLSTRGWKELGAGSPQRAEREFSRAIECYERLVADFAEHRGNRLALANCHNDLATTYKSLGRPDAAEAGYRRALSLKNQLLAEMPHDRDCRFHQAHSYLGLGYLQREQGRPGDAADSFQHAVLLFGGLANESPKNYGDRRALGSALGHLCDALVQAGRQDEAEAALRRLVGTFDALARDLPNQLDDRRRACSSHSRLGRLLRGQGRHADAEQSFRTALEIACSLGRDQPANDDDRARSRECLRDLIETLRSLDRDTEADEVRVRYQLEFPEL